MPFSPSDLDHIRALAYKHIGNVLEPQNDHVLKRNLGKRLDALKCSEVEYMTIIRYTDSNTQELQTLLRKVLNHETYFFRDQGQYKCYVNTCLSELFHSKGSRGERNLKIWSAASSTGEEAYTLSILTQQNLPKDKPWNVQIIGTDIDEEILAHARKGIYSDSRTGLVPPEILSNSFNTIAPNQHQVQPTYRNHCQFSYLNFMDQNGMARMRGFDVIFCKNVLFYFDDPTQKKIISSLFSSLRQGGYFFTDYSLNITKVMQEIDHVKTGPFFYQKP